MKWSRAAGGYGERGAVPERHLATQRLDRNAGRGYRKQQTEHRPIVAVTTATNSRAVETAVAPQRQRGLRGRPVDAGEASQRGQRAVGRDSEYRPKPSAAALLCCAVEIAVIVLCKGSIGIRTIHPSPEGIERAQCAIGRHFEHRSITAGILARS